MEKISRTSRDLDNREANERAKSWRPAAILPVPNRQSGYTFRWIRTSTFGHGDAKNVSSRFREGWEPVKAEDHPELMITSDKGSAYPDGIEVGGLLLCKTSNENVKQRTDYYSQRSRQQVEAVDNSVMSLSDPRMPLKVERRSRVSTGSEAE